MYHLNLLHTLLLPFCIPELSVSNTFIHSFVHSFFFQLLLPSCPASLLHLLNVSWVSHIALGKSVVISVGMIKVIRIKKAPLPGGSDGKESACNVGDLGSIPGWGRSPAEENGYPLQHSCLENPMDRGSWSAQSMGSQRVGHGWETEWSELHFICFWVLIHGRYFIS